MPEPRDVAMTWAKISDSFGDDEVLLGLPRGTRLLWVELTVWACKQATDGRIPRYVLRRVTDEPDVDDAVAQLVECGLLIPTAQGWELRDFLRDQRSREEVTRARELSAVRQRRQRLHRSGDHSACSEQYCKFSKSRVTNDVTPATSHATPTRPDPTRAQARGGRVGHGADSPGVVRSTDPVGNPPVAQERSRVLLHRDIKPLLPTREGIL